MKSAAPFHSRYQKETPFFNCIVPSGTVYLWARMHEMQGQVSISAVSAGTEWTDEDQTWDCCPTLPAGILRTTSSRRSTYSAMRAA
jgi:hypothetical protein